MSLRSHATALLIAASSFVFWGCGINSIQPEPGQTVDEWRIVGGYDKLEISRAMRVTLTLGNSDSILVNASEGFLQYLRTEVSGSTLRVYVDDNVDISRLEGAGVFITVPAITDVSLSGASVFECQDTIQVSRFSVQASGASGVNCGIEADNVSLNLSGASFFDLSGETDELTAFLSGASIVRSYDLQTQNTTANLSGASLMECSVGRRLTVNASGASALRYRGNPTVEQNVSGGSTVTRDN